jgi:D-aminoacyl-tRNA deacylase
MSSIIICSLNDPAGTNIRERLIESDEFEETDEMYDGYPVYSKDQARIVCSHKDIVFVDDVESHFGYANYYYISRHRAESGQPSLTCHVTGNFGPNALGGNPGEICTYSPSRLKNYFLELNEMRDRIPEKYELTLEATHHGPTSLKSPMQFVELGSTPEQWVDVEAAEFVAEALFKSLEKQARYDKCAIGIGGTHYPEKFGKFILSEADVALGPIIPKYSLEYFSEKILAEMINKSTEQVRLALIDKKGLGQHKERVMNILKTSTLELVNV